MNFSQLFTLRNQPPGRFAYCLRMVLLEAGALAAEGHDVAGLTVMCQEHIRFGRDTLKLRMMYEAGQVGTPESKSKASAIDAAADRVISAAFRQVDDYRVNFSPDHAKAKAAQKVITAVFARGVVNITRQSHVQQFESMETILEIFDTELVHEVAALNLEDWVERIRELTGEYGAELGRHKVKGISYSDIRDAETECQERLCQLVARVMGDFNDRSDAHSQVRSRLLAPIVMQDNAIADANRRSRRVADLDPDTGVEQDVPESTDNAGSVAAVEPASV